MLLGVSRQTVTKWEAEKATPEMDKLLKMCSLFGCTLDDLVTGDLTTRPREAAAAVPAGPVQDVCGYDEHARSRALRMATGVALIVAGCGVFSLVDALTGSLGEDASDAVSAIALLAFVFAGIALIVTTVMDHSSFRREHPWVEDFYTAEERRRTRARLGRDVVAGIAFYFAAVVCAALADALADESATEDLAQGAFLLLTACGVWLHVHAGLMAGRMNVAAYNRAATEELDEDQVASSSLTPGQRDDLLERRRRAKPAAAASGVIMIAATAIALVWLFVGHAVAGDVGVWHRVANLFWLPWPIGGLACGIVDIVLAGRAERR